MLKRDAKDEAEADMPDCFLGLAESLQCFSLSGTDLGNLPVDGGGSVLNLGGQHPIT